MIFAFYMNSNNRFSHLINKILIKNDELLLWRRSVELKVFKLEPDPLILQGQEGEGALGHVLVRVQEDRSLEGPVLRHLVRRRDELLIAG